MKYIVIILAFIGVMHLAAVVEDNREELLAPQPSGYQETTKIVVNHDENTCSDYSDSFDIHIKIVYVPYTDEFAGQWNSVENTITLNNENGRNVEVVAHEVSHAVDTIVESHHLEDYHYEAYLQGVYTACVWQIVEQDTYAGIFRFLKQ